MGWVMSFECRVDSVLAESGLSRVYEHTLKHDYGLISAFRGARDCGKGTPYTYKENKQRNQSLLAKLRLNGYGVTKISGNYIENYGSPDAREVQEESFLVVDVNDKKNLRQTLCELGEFFEQDAIIYGKAGQPGVLIGTNHCAEAYPGYGVEVASGGLVFGQTGQILSRVNGRPFVFKEAIKSYAVAKYPSELRGPYLESKLNWWDIVVRD